ncbi:MAG: hypothetical protein WAU89_13380 [Candidatus Acidiferrales bacterium]
MPYENSAPAGSPRMVANPVKNAEVSHDGAWELAQTHGENANAAHAAGVQNLSLLQGETLKGN